MTDEPTPPPPKVPPKLKIRPAGAAASPAGSGDPSVKPETPSGEKPTAPAEVSATQPAPDADVPKAPASEAPTLVFKKTPAANSEQQNKKKTSRIPLDVALTSRIDTALEASAQEAPKTIRLARPGEAKPAAPATEAGDSAPKTIRLARPTTTPASDGADSGPKTIRLQRPVDAPTRTMPPAEGQTAPKPEPKSKTSRISLDDVLKSDASESTGGGATGVKTIRLKKPGDAASPPAPAAAKSTEPDVDEAKSRTARLDAPETTATDSEDGAPPTQRKTIRIKRPDGTVAGAGSGPKPARKLTLARDSANDATQADSDDTTEAETQIEPESAKPSVEASIGWIWSLAAVAAVLVAAVVVYLLAVQAFPGADLSWPGQINL